MRILVVDDDFASRMFLKNAVGKYGVCDTASDGLEAVKAFQSAIDEKNEYNIIFLDIMMPFLDGLGVLRLIREMEKQKKIDEKQKSKIIMTSAINDSKTLENAFHLGCDAFMSKPLDFDKLSKKMDEYI